MNSFFEAHKARFLVATVIVFFIRSASAELEQSVLISDGSGFRIDRQIVTDDSEIPREVGPVLDRGQGIVWHVYDNMASVRTSSAGLGSHGSLAWVAFSLNNHRFSLFESLGTGVPIFEYDLSSERPYYMPLAAAKDGNLGIVCSSYSHPAILRGFNAFSGATPLWTYRFDEAFPAVNWRGVAVSANGSIVLAAAYNQDSQKHLLVTLDGETGEEIARSIGDHPIQGIELCDDGSRAILGQITDSTVFDVVKMATIATFPIGGGAVFQRISCDGKIVALGSNTCEVYRDQGKTWVKIFQLWETYQYFGEGVAVSADGKTLFAVSNDNRNFLDHTFRTIDLETGVELARLVSHGSGYYQDSIAAVEVSDDGQIFAAASWGNSDNTHPEVQVFDRNLNLLASIDTPGSPFALDITRNGQYVLVGGKAVHANEMGRGSDTYVLRVSGATAPPVPTLSQNALITLILLVGGLQLFLILRRKRRAAHLR